MNENLENRVRKLERRNRLTLLLAITMGIIVLLGSAVQSDDATTLRGQRIELVDAKGSLQAVLGTDKEGSTGLFIHDPEGRLRLSLTHDTGQSALFIRDAEETVRIGVAQFAHGGGGVALHGENSKGAAVLYHKQAGSLSFYDDEGNATTRIPEKK